MEEKERFLHSINSKINDYRVLHGKLDEKFIDISQQVKMIENFKIKKNSMLEIMSKHSKSSKKVKNDIDYFLVYLEKFVKNKIVISGLIRLFDVYLGVLQNLYDINNNESDYLVSPEELTSTTHQLEEVMRKFSNWEKKYIKIVKKYNRRYD